LFIDARDLPDGHLIECDLCIVGAGAAGITIAREFIGSATKVAVIESGGFQPDEETQALYEGDVIGFPYDSLETMRLRYFGGTTNHWAGNCRPLDEIDFLKRASLPHSGWPFRRSELVPYYERAAAVCGVAPFDFDGATWANNGPGVPFSFDATKLISGVSHKSAPVRFGTEYRPDLEGAENIVVYLHGNITDIETNETAENITSLEGKCLTGTSFAVRARAYVLALGGIENARLLLVSNGVEKPGLGNSNDLVGRFFMEHPHLVSAEILLSDRFRDLGFYASRPVEGRVVRGVVALSPELIENEQLTNLYFNLRPVRHRSDGEKSAIAIMAHLDEWDLPDDFWTHLGNVISDLDDVADAAYRKITDAPRPVDNLGVHCRIEPVPDPDSRISLQGERDALGMPRVRLSWNPGDLALKSLKRGIEVLALEVGRLGLGRLRFSFDPESDEWPERVKLSGHHIGTTRMHEDVRQGVVDAQCRVHSVNNLFVAGSSVFPTSGCNNPTLTIVALALRLADHLKANISG
jgi:choline dehydrogenase-like flavoprotein